MTGSGNRQALIENSDYLTYTINSNSRVYPDLHYGQRIGIILTAGANQERAVRFTFQYVYGLIPATAHKPVTTRPVRIYSLRGDGGVLYAVVRKDMLQLV